ncbi:hypothetical protein ANANG_G00294850 [Anguilla anguilla]|uniref:AIG1-type G domain-containing protein n=1 Tax=Anguilla anguilla TaxID=7936 RepID=A0A9D3LQH7_ANGAN|nr:hypothetical protein ANANG_G00294850 [Anguilla anguilla]
MNLRPSLWGRILRFENHRLHLSLQRITCVPISFILSEDHPKSLYPSHPNLCQEEICNPQKGGTVQKILNMAGVALPRSCGWCWWGRRGRERATGNTILGEERFKSELCMSSVTGGCEKARGTVLGRRVTLVDTPGLFDTSLSQQDVQDEILRCLAMSAPGPHAILLVLQIGRFTEEEQRSVEIIQTIFQSDAAKYTILIFTHADRLKGISFQNFISKQDKRIQDLVERFDRRVLPFNNEDREDHGQVADLLEMINRMLAQREKPYFTNQAFQKMDQALEVYQHEHLERKQEEIEREKKRAAAEWEVAWADFSIQMNDKKQESELKKRRIEQNIKTLSTKKAEVEQQLKVETKKLKQLEQVEKARGQKEKEYRKIIDSEIKRVEKEIDDRYSESAREEAEGSYDFLRKNAWLILGGAALMATGVGFGAGAAMMATAAPAAAGAGGLTAAAAAAAAMAAEIGTAAAAVAANIGPAAAAVAAEIGPAAVAAAANVAPLLAAQCSIQ